MFFFDFYLDVWPISFMVTGFFIFVFCSVVLAIGSLIEPQAHTEESAALVWSSPMAIFDYEGWKGIGNYKLLSALLLALMIATYIFFQF